MLMNYPIGHVVAGFVVAALLLLTSFLIDYPNCSYPLATVEMSEVKL